MPTPENAEWFLRTGSIYGLGFIAIAGFLWLAFYGTFYILRETIHLVQDVRRKWLPDIVSGHQTFLEHTKVSNAATAQAVTKLTESYEASSDNHSKTHRAVKLIASALQYGDVCDEARKDLDEAIKELQ